jgi:hypothetical protein
MQHQLLVLVKMEEIKKEKNDFGSTFHLALTIRTAVWISDFATYVWISIPGTC